MRERLQLVTKTFKPGPALDAGSLFVETVKATMQDLYDYYWKAGDRSAALSLALKFGQIKKAHVAYEKGQRAEETES